MNTITKILVEDGIVSWESYDSGEQQIKSVCIVIPTYNERYNIEKVLDLIYRTNKEFADRATLRVLVVDDNSPDGTAEVVRKYMQKNENVHLLLRKEKEGLGRAYIAGMQYALDIFAPDVICEMDADLSHNPEDIARMLQAIEDGSDCVIGSRYVTGGSVPLNWGIHRKVTSTCANLAARTILGIPDVQDCSGGFRAIRASLLRKIPLQQLNVKGYAFQAVLLEEIVQKGGKVSEVPIDFSDRELGSSKMTMHDVLEGFTAFARVRAGRIAERLTGST